MRGRCAGERVRLRVDIESRAHSSTYRPSPVIILTHPAASRVDLFLVEGWTGEVEDEVGGGLSTVNLRGCRFKNLKWSAQEMRNWGQGVSIDLELELEWQSSKSIGSEEVEKITSVGVESETYIEVLAHSSGQGRLGTQKGHPRASLASDGMAYKTIRKVK